MTVQTFQCHCHDSQVADWEAHAKGVRTKTRAFLDATSIHKATRGEYCALAYEPFVLYIRDKPFGRLELDGSVWYWYEA